MARRGARNGPRFGTTGADTPERERREHGGRTCELQRAAVPVVRAVHGHEDRGGGGRRVVVRPAPRSHVRLRGRRVADRPARPDRGARVMQAEAMTERLPLRDRARWALLGEQAGTVDALHENYRRLMAEVLGETDPPSPELKRGKTEVWLEVVIDDVRLRVRRVTAGAEPDFGIDVCPDGTWFRVHTLTQLAQRL